MALEKVYYEADAQLEALNESKVGIIGYGIQGRAQALNLRDSGVDVLVGNRGDRYVAMATDDGFDVLSVEEVVDKADVLLLLIPDQAHREVYTTIVEPRLRKGAALVVAHGFSLHFKQIIPRDDLDVLLLAPRMPGGPIREYYTRGSGIPAFVDVFQDASGQAWRTLLALAKGMGFTRPGVVHVALRDETELDLFTEQYLVPTIMKAIQSGFEALVEAGYPALPALMELYASGELGEVLMAAADVGLFQGWQQNASPTCQFGIASSYAQALDMDQGAFMKDVIHRIQSGDFVESLRQEGEAGYAATQAHWARLNGTLLSSTHDELNKLVPFAEARDAGK
jgi:ketol-acid reductoisomerase